MSDLPDWTTGVDILAQTIANLRVDIRAQTLGNLTIDIAAQSVGNINVNLAASAITLNINIAASAVTLQVNIASQTANLNINIAASAVTLNVNLSSSSITLNVNISSQTANINVNIAASAATVNIQITAQNVGVYLQPEYAALTGVDKNFSYEASLAPVSSSYFSYTVTAGKTLYISAFAFAAYTTGSPDAELRHHCMVRIYNNTTALNLMFMGGPGGGGLALPKPLKATAGQVVRFYLYNQSGHTLNVVFHIYGYEI